VHFSLNVAFDITI